MNEEMADKLRELIAANKKLSKELSKECDEHRRFVEEVAEQINRVRKQVRLETAMEIMELIKISYKLPIDDIARKITEKYGVELKQT